MGNQCARSVQPVCKGRAAEGAPYGMGRGLCGGVLWGGGLYGVGSLIGQGVPTGCRGPYGLWVPRGWGTLWERGVSFGWGSL